MRHIASFILLSFLYVFHMAFFVMVSSGIRDVTTEGEILSYLTSVFISTVLGVYLFRKGSPVILKVVCSFVVACSFVFYGICMMQCITYSNSTLMTRICFFSLLSHILVFLPVLPSVSRLHSFSSRRSRGRCQ